MKRTVLLISLWWLTAASGETADEPWLRKGDIPLPPLSSVRSERFPSPEERLKVYMSNWYAPPCQADDKDQTVQYQYINDDDDGEWPRLQLWATDVNHTRLDLASEVVPDTAFFIEPETILDCLSPEGEPRFEKRIQFRKNMNMYCIDAAASILTALHHVDDFQVNEDGSLKNDIPTVVQFGDLKHSHFFGHVIVPHLKKFRSAVASPDRLDEVVRPSCFGKNRPALSTVHSTDLIQPIVWKLASRRHFGNLEKVFREDTPWDQKKNMAIWRGQLTGSRDGGFDKSLAPEVNCQRLNRCKLVYNHANSKLIHARLTSTRNRLPDSLNGVPLVAPSTTIRRLLEFKGIIMLEGNDVASGLKWALLSQSVVLMPPPRHTSWALEELLEPWVHYVPLNENATDVEEKMQWVVDHDDVARRIAERSSLWIEDLVFHPDSAEEDRWLQEEIIRRYRRHFVQA